MPGKNFYHELQTHGLKLAKFKQDRLFAMLETTGGIPSTLSAAKAHGACTSLCALWLQAMLRGGASGLVRDSDTKADPGANLKVASLGLQMTQKFLSDTRNVTQKIPDLYASLGMEAVADITKRTVPQVLGMCFPVVQARKGGCVAIQIEIMFTDATSHSVALCNVNGVLYFFDPNVGEYRVDKMQGFASAYYKAVPKALGKRYLGAYLYGIGAKSGSSASTGKDGGKSDAGPGATMLSTTTTAMAGTEGSASTLLSTGALPVVSTSLSSSATVTVTPSTQTGTGTGQGSTMAGTL